MTTKKLLKKLMQTAIPFRVHNKVPGSYVLYENKERAYFYILFAWEHYGESYPCEKIIKEIECKINGVQIMKENGFLRYSLNPLPRTFGYCLYVSFSCLKNNTKQLQQLEQLKNLITNIEKIQDICVDLRDDVEDANKSLQKLIDLKVVKKQKLVKRPTILDATKHYLNKNNLDKSTQEHLMLAAKSR